MSLYIPIYHVRHLERMKQNSFIQRTIKTWNELKFETKNSEFINCFKNAIDRDLHALRYEYDEWVMSNQWYNLFQVDITNKIFENYELNCISIMYFLYDYCCILHIVTFLCQYEIPGHLKATNSLIQPLTPITITITKHVLKIYDYFLNSSA